MSDLLETEKQKAAVNASVSKWTAYLTAPSQVPSDASNRHIGLIPIIMDKISRPSTPIQDSVPTGLVKDLQSMGLTRSLTNLDTLIDVFKAQYLDRGVVDDKSYLMERVITVASGLPSTSTQRKALTGSLLDKLWNQLLHPPLSYLGNKYQYRTADGSYNNIMYPQLGQANTPYARSVRPMKKMPGALPDAGLIFDTLMARKAYRPHANKISSMLFYLASIIIHDLFRTSHVDFAISKTSSYLDLSPLYGNNEDEQKEMRIFKDGKIKPDAFSEKRLLGFPPGVGVLLLSFGRYHNYIVDMLLKINQDERFTKRLTSEQSDEKLFQTGRLITCGLYINIILIDYVRVILNLNRTETTWCLDPRAEIQKVFAADGTPQGIGNQVSAEFNLVYRWHSPVSERDANWTQDFYNQLFPLTDPNDLALEEFISGVSKWEKSIPQDPAQRTFDGLVRDPVTGKFRDEDLVERLCTSIEDCAGSYGANHVPPVLKLVEILGIEQARSWELASLNEFRAFCGLKEHATFEDINSDPEVANTLRQLYGHPDYVEMYPGLVAEEPKVPMTPGAGLLPGFTISTAILSDAVALVRGDRFYTIDYTTGNLTNWGFNEVSSNPEIAYGCVFHKLMHRAYPGSFEYNSVYALYPFTVPDENKEIYKGFGKADQYVYGRPSTSVASSIPSTLSTSQAGELDVLTTKKDTVGRVLAAMESHMDFDTLLRTSFLELTYAMLQSKAARLGDNYWVDAIRDISNIVIVQATSQLFSLNFTTSFSDHQLHGMLCTIANYIFQLSPTPTAKLFEHREAASTFWKALSGNKSSDGTASVIIHTMSSKLGSLFTSHESTVTNDNLAALAKHLATELGDSVDDDIVILAAGVYCLRMSIFFSHLLTHVLSSEIYFGFIDNKPSLRKALESQTSMKPTDAEVQSLRGIVYAFSLCYHIKAAPGLQGVIKTVEIDETTKAWISEDWSTLSAYPTTCKVMHEKLLPNDENAGI